MLAAKVRAISVSNFVPCGTAQAGCSPVATPMMEIGEIALAGTMFWVMRSTLRAPGASAGEARKQPTEWELKEFTKYQDGCRTSSNDRRSR
jgi:hypothetical protein